MAKEYRKQNVKSASGSAGRQFFLVLMSFVCGYLSATLFDIAHLTAWFKTTVLAQHANPAQKAAPSVSHQTQLPKPKFEFYTLLANERTAVPAVTHESPVNAAGSGANRVPNALAAKAPVENSVIAVITPKVPKESVHVAQGTHKESYLVQVASFKNKQDADRIKATLTLKGFNVNVATVTHQNINWYRVIVGPYASRTQAEKAQIEVARSEHITGMVRKMDA